jgi:uncharacterized protein (DUF2252 family)
MIGGESDALGGQVRFSSNHARCAITKSPAGVNRAVSIVFTPKHAASGYVAVVIRSGLRLAKSLSELYGTCIRPVLYSWHDHPPRIAVARDPIQDIIRFNRRFVGRYPDTLRQKIERLSGSSFGFFRGTFHLFASDMVAGVLNPWPTDNPFSQVEIDVVGDIHSENYGTFKAADGLVYFDINDFDETTRGSFDFDCKRAATSLVLALSAAGVAWLDVVGHVASFVRCYAKTIERFATKGGAETFGYSDQNPPDCAPVRKLLRTAVEMSRAEFLEKLTRWNNGKREIVRTAKYFELRAADRAQAERLVKDYVSRASAAKNLSPGFFGIEDICGRIAGNGSLGRMRYAVLFAGDGSKAAKNILLEFKESLPSAYDEARGRVADAVQRRNRAAEVQRIEQAMQTASNRYLGYAQDGDESFQVKGIGPREQRVTWDTTPKTESREGLALVYAELLAKAHAKSDFQTKTRGQAQQAIAAALAERTDTFIKRITTFALSYAELVEDDHRRFIAQRREVEQGLGLVAK